MRMTTKCLTANTSLSLFFAPVFMSGVQPNDSVFYFLANRETRDCIQYPSDNFIVHENQVNNAVSVEAEENWITIHITWC